MTPDSPVSRPRWLSRLLVLFEGDLAFAPDAEDGRLRGSCRGEMLAQVFVCHGQFADTKLMVRITDGISGRVGLVPAA